MDRVSEELGNWAWWTNVIDKSANWYDSAAVGFYFLPLSKQAYKEISFKILMQNLWDEIHVADEGSLENNGNIWSIEKLNWVGLELSADLGILDIKIKLESLEVNDQKVNKDSGDETV